MPAPSYIIKCLLAIVICLPLNLAAADNSEFFLERYSTQREVFLQLTQLLEEGEVSAAKARRSELNNYPLADYFDYLLLKKEIYSSAKPASLLGRVDKMKHDARLQRKLLSAVKNRSAKLGRWKDYRKASLGKNVPVHPCDDLASSLKNTQSYKFTKASADLWVDVSRHTKRCDESYAVLLSKVNDVPTRALWSRTVALLKRGETKKIKPLLKYYNKRDRRTVEAWIKGRSKPDQLLPSKAMRGDSIHHQEVATYLLKRWARNDLVAAMAFWRKNGNRFGFSNKRVQETLAKYAVLAAKRGLPEAKRLLDTVEANRDVRFWRVRLALQSRDWFRCLIVIDQLTEKEMQEPRWQYWRARCLEGQGQHAAAAKIYISISETFDYYGFLAADRISRDYKITLNQPAATDTEIQQLAQSKQIARAIEYFLVDVSWEGRREWNAALKSAKKETLIAAAYVAKNVGWYDRALAAMHSADEPGALTTLYPAPFTGYVDFAANEYSVEPAWIYGVMRRESLFIADIKSSAGAVGLMQLMPATAKQVGKQLGVKAPKWRLIESELNINLGTKYLSYLSERFNNNMVLVTAAYNAGPNRADKWLADRPGAADIWVETIPFDETRSYVKAVLFNTIVSQWLLEGGSVIPLQYRMPDLSPPG